MFEYSLSEQERRELEENPESTTGANRPCLRVCWMKGERCGRCHNLLARKIVLIPLLNLLPMKRLLLSADRSVLISHPELVL